VGKNRNRNLGVLVRCNVQPESGFGNNDRQIAYTGRSTIERRRVGPETRCQTKAKKRTKGRRTQPKQRESLSATRPVARRATLARSGEGPGAPARANEPAKAGRADHAARPHQSDGNPANTITFTSPRGRDAAHDQRSRLRSGHRTRRGCDMGLRGRTVLLLLGTLPQRV
jgi:hypothetical protein